MHSISRQSCPICGKDDAHKLFVTYSPYLDRTLLYDIMACRGCGHRWAVGDTSPETLARIYSGSFHQSAQQWTDDAASSVAPVMVNARLRAAWLRERGLGGRLLDVGAGNGYFVKAAADAGFDAEGLELSPDAAGRATELGAKVSVGDFLTAPLQDRTINVVTMWDVLSGFADPSAAVQRAAGLLRHGGHLVVTIVDGTSMVSRLGGRYWPLMIPPVNLQFFSPDSIRRLMNANSLVVEALLHQGKRVSVRFAGQKLLRSLRLASLEPALERLVPQRWSVTLNLGDIATVVARHE
jgi:SAM-dependent methyltransferase